VTLNREAMLDTLDSRETWDALVIGGGATGLGIAVDAASRGLRTVLLERADFAQATSSRSTKLAHGGVRYLKQGRVALVREALRERGILARNAPHLVKTLAFVVPCYRSWDTSLYGVGLKLYDALARERPGAASRLLNAEETGLRLPNVVTERLRGGVLYRDAQFDDARLALTLAQTAADHGATLLNYARVDRLMKDGNRVIGAYAVDVETGREYEVRAKVVVNATGIFADAVKRMDDVSTRPSLAPSQGAHLVLSREFFAGETAMMVPYTDDGRVFFMIPWLGRVLAGTTDTPVEAPESEPVARDAEVAFLLRHARRFLERKPSESDVLSVFAGHRPLIRGNARNSKSLTREHVVETSASGLVTVLGGKWTTYRRMSEDAVDVALRVGGFEPRPCRTATLALYGSTVGSAPEASFDDVTNLYGSDADALRSLAATCPTLSEPLHPRLPYTMTHVVWAARREMARTVEDALSRRTRCLTLDARATMEVAPRVAAVLARELGRDDVWARSQTASFIALAARYLPRKDATEAVRAP
jgi:glycerol-3-phosphate dehydrogenase